MYKLVATIILLILSCYLEAQIKHQTPDLDPVKVHRIDGVEWASNMATSFKTGAFYFAYINENLQGIVVQKLPNGSIKSKIVIKDISNDENHSEISMALDNDGYLHVSAGNHNSPTRYFVSLNPEKIDSFIQKDNNPTIGGLLGERVTYLTFYKSNYGTLYATYRNMLVDGYVTGSRVLMLAKYDTQMKRWSLIGSKKYEVNQINCQLLTGDELKMNAFVWNNSGVGDMTPTSEKCYTNASYQGYKLKVVFDKNNGMHVTYNMADSINKDAPYSNAMTHCFYAFSPDEGETWFKADGSVITSLPITKSNGDLVIKQYPTGYQYPNKTTEITMPNSSFLLLNPDNRPIVIQKTYGPAQLNFLKFVNSKWLKTNYLLDNKSISTDRVYSNLKRGEFVIFNANDSLKLSNNEMKNWYFSTGIQSRVSYYTCLDRYFLQKTGHLRYYSRNDVEQTAQPVTLWFDHTDNKAPAKPTHLKIKNIANNKATIQWNASKSFDAVLYYVYVNNKLVDSTENQTFTLHNLKSDTKYKIKIRVRDFTNNFSAFSNVINLKI